MVNMPDDGKNFAEQIQEVVCKFCGPIRESYFYWNPDTVLLNALTKKPMTKEEFWLEVHNNDTHFWNATTQEWEA